MPQVITSTGEVVDARSPAEFFTENQHIAGFDNPGKSLYTTIRELVENSLDAAESIGVLPSITIEIEEMDQAELDDHRGLGGAVERVDESLFEVAPAKGRAKSKGGGRRRRGRGRGEGEPKGADAAGEGAAGARGGKKAAVMFHRVVCRDNGCGMAHDAIPEMLGRVLERLRSTARAPDARQVRARREDGAHLGEEVDGAADPRAHRARAAAAARRADATSSRCVLDIDIQANEPRVLEHARAPNAERWRGAEAEVVVGGQWSTYRPRIVQYFQQLAIITPYAELGLEFTKRPARDAANAAAAAAAARKQSLALTFARRSETMPERATEARFHPSSLNNLLLQQLLLRSRQGGLLGFLAADLAGVTKPIAKRLLAEAAASASQASIDASALAEGAKPAARLAEARART